VRAHRGRPLVPAAVLVLAIVFLTACQSAAQSSPAADPSRPPPALAVDPSDGSLLKAAAGVSRSLDQGRTWSALPIPAELRPSAIRQVATTAAAPGTLFAAGPGAGVLRSDDDGRTWSTAAGDLPSHDVSVLAVHSFRPGTLYALLAGGGLFRTEDGGDRWQKMDDGPPTRVLGLAHSTLPGSMNTGWLYAATDDGPYLSMDCF
jgi:photosystem II stability/assembly factor-like uncharacterized protein